MIVWSIQTRLFLLILSSIILLSCNDVEETVIINTDSTQVIESISNSETLESTKNIDSIRLLKEQEYLANQKLKEEKKVILDKVAKEKNLSKDKLLEFLPKNIDGFKELPSATGKTIESDDAITIFARKQFLDSKGKRSILFDIFDYGRGNPVLNAHIYENKPDDLDATVTDYKIPNAKGFYYWLNQKAYGHIEVLADSRFVVMVRLTGFEKNDDILKSYISMIDINNLIQSGKR